MTRHDEAVLWDYAARDLDPDEARVVEGHLDDCPECREQLASVQVAREALEAARQTTPMVAWNAVDEAVGRLVEKRLAAHARRPLLRLTLGIAVLGAMVAVAVVALNRPAVAPLTPVVVDAALAPAPVAARVDRAEGLSLVGTGNPLLDGATLASGDVLETTTAGRAFVHLPDLSHVRLGPASKLSLTRAEVDEVTLTLSAGHLALRASPQDRKGFVVHVGGLTVHVGPSVLVVTNSPEAAEVAVAEGRVAVEFVGGVTEFIDAGTRMRVDRRGRVAKGLKVSGALMNELNELTAVADATTAVETHSAVVAASGGRASAPPLLSAQGPPRGLPRLNSQQARARQVTLPPEATGSVVAPSATNQGVAAPTPGTPLPPATAPMADLAPVTQRLEPKAELVVEAPASAAEASEWATLPTPQPEPAPGFAEWKPAAKQADPPQPTVTPSAKSPARDLESIFLQRAQASVEAGGCERFLPGLEELAMDTVKTPHTELSRVLRARCFDAQLRPRQALAEYRKYLEEYPRGRYESEAREAVGN